MNRSRLKSETNKTASEKDLRLYKIQRNVISKLNKNHKNGYFKEKLPKGKIVKDFWNYWKPYFARKGTCKNEPIILVENGEILMKIAEICKTFNGYFVNIRDELDIYI